LCFIYLIKCSDHTLKKETISKAQVQELLEDGSPNLILNSLTGKEDSNDQDQEKTREPRDTEDSVMSRLEEDKDHKRVMINGQMGTTIEIKPMARKRKRKADLTKNLPKSRYLISRLSLRKIS